MQLITFLEPLDWSYSFQQVISRCAFTPDLSPIELCWSKLKQFLRSRAARSVEALNQAITNVISYITEDDALNWFNHCGLFT